MAERELVRVRSGAVIAGVAGGLADYLGWSRGKVRLGFFVFGLFGAGELAYIIMWLLMPKELRTH